MIVRNPLVRRLVMYRGNTHLPVPVSPLQMETMMGDSRQSVAALQTQLDDYRDRSRKDLQEAQRNNKERLAELQRAQSNLKTQQEEVRTEQEGQLKKSV